MPLHLFRLRAFSLFWLARLLTTVATNAQAVAIGWQVYSIARETRSVEASALMVGMVGLAQFLPLFALSLPAGETADRYDRRRILLLCSGLQLVCSLAFLALALTPAPGLAALFAVAAGFGVARAFVMPAGTALAPTLVPREFLPQAVALNTLAAQGGMVLGPWLGGVLCAADVSWAYGASAALYGLAGAMWLVLLFQRLTVAPPSAGGGRLEMIREGLAYVWGNKLVFGAISLDLCAVLLGGVTALLPVFARDVLMVGADGFGLLRSATAAGAGLTTIVLSVAPIRRHAGPWMLWSVALYGVGTLIFAYSDLFWLSLAMLALLGAADSVSVFVRQSLVQIVTPDAMRGRVSAVSTLFISASNELGEFESGVAARILGPVGAAAFGGFGSLAVTGLWARLFPALRCADRLTPADPPAKAN
jgi:MFS family permease